MAMLTWYSHTENRVAVLEQSRWWGFKPPIINPSGPSTCFWQKWCLSSHAYKVYSLEPNRRNLHAPGSSGAWIMWGNRGFVKAYLICLHQHTGSNLNPGFYKENNQRNTETPIFF
ncbi:hypothetical protein BABINDRAFT_117313 [Babjeviella inositovora NRRL Y-12698]|uniref:Uncharacterized protein n=1 Tax=Babjeviella inositovora NRRL Y-12698 TaxID=984486 RepID=A0A1E3QH37_9ASCO|nr:uncharacterized protein BABINDRAFT_117313 [Babjeviella inositovora NRRL Y-12698]ODQ76940.1 hypothetical protein BABINDRAFT_117313 [Babjeviella inositovora NRRL Y-12698]